MDIDRREQGHKAVTEFRTELKPESEPDPRLGTGPTWAPMRYGVKRGKVATGLERK